MFPTLKSHPSLFALKFTSSVQYINILPTTLLSNDKALESTTAQSELEELTLIKLT